MTPRRSAAGPRPIRTRPPAWALACALATALACAPAGATEPAAAGWVEETVGVPILGKVRVYRPEPASAARGVVLFVSGDGGWNLGVIDMARRAAPQALVAGLSLPAWRKAAEKEGGGRCWFPAGDLETIAQTVEKTFGLPRYIKPILVGYSSGATLVYGALAQAPDAFAGAVSLGFCPDLEAARPLCAHGDWRPAYDAKKRTSLLPPRADLTPRGDGEARWTALQGQVDQVCDAAAVAAFVEQIPAARVVPLPKVGHGFSVPRNWGAAYDGAVEALLEPEAAWDRPAPEARGTASPGGSSAGPPAATRERLDALDLPLEVEWPEGAEEALIFVSGDGGWAELDREVTTFLAGHGIAVVGWNTLRYFWQRRTPETFRADLARVIEALPGEMRVYAGGYSFGAEVLPVALARDATPAHPAGAAAAGLSRIRGLVLLAPGPYAAFEVSPLDWIRSRERATRYPVRQALQEIAGLPVLCLEPSGHDGSGCPDGSVRGLERVALPGGHHFAGDFEGLSERVLKFLDEDRAAARGGR
jgi:type IV secretory pathway VirJ component